jgi:hypothetical protein
VYSRRSSRLSTLPLGFRGRLSRHIAGMSRRAAAVDRSQNYFGLRGQVLANLLLQVICKLLFGRHSECAVTALNHSPDNFRAHGQLVAADPCPGLAAPLRNSESLVSQTRWPSAGGYRQRSGCVATARHRWSLGCSWLLQHPACHRSASPEPLKRPRRVILRELFSGRFGCGRRATGANGLLESTARSASAGCRDMW